MAELGYGENDQATVVGYGPDPNNKYPTTYFRHTFVLTNAAAYNSLAFQLKFDDGGVAYLNGTEILRVNMPGRHDQLQYLRFRKRREFNGD